MARSRRTARGFVATLGVVSLFGLAWLVSIPHSWHTQDGPRACTICLAYRTASSGPVAPVEVEPPDAELWRAPEAPAAPSRSPLLIARTSRSPPC